MRTGLLQKRGDMCVFSCSGRIAQDSRYSVASERINIVFCSRNDCGGTCDVVFRSISYQQSSFCGAVGCGTCYGIYLYVGHSGIHDRALSQRFICHIRKTGLRVTERADYQRGLRTTDDSAPRNLVVAREPHRDSVRPLRFHGERLDDNHSGGVDRSDDFELRYQAAGGGNNVCDAIHWSDDGFCRGVGHKPADSVGG